MRTRLVYAAVAVLAAFAWGAAAGALPGPGVHEGAGLSGGTWVYTVGPGDTLISIGARLGVPFRVIARTNGIATGSPLPIGRTLAIDNRHVVPAGVPGEALIVNVPQRMLFAFGEGGATAYPVAVGRPGWPTPIGPFSVTDKETDPYWDVPPSIREEMAQQGHPSPPRQVPPGPANPLGSRWIRTSFPGIGIHGTPQASSVYRDVTHGCIRMHPAHIVEVFARLPVGSAGRFIYEPVLVAVTRDGIFLEAHRDIYGLAGGDVAGAVRAWAEARGTTGAIAWRTVDEVLTAREGVARRIGEIND